MKLNNKGMTLVELIVSIGLLSIVLGFFYKILLDVKYEKDNSGFAANNQINRSELIRTIEEDFLYLNEKGIYIENYDISGNVLTLYFSEEKNKAIIVSNDKKSITYNAPEGSDKKTWDLADDDYVFGDITASITGNYYITFTIPVFNNLDDDSKIDDIELITVSDKKVTPPPVHTHTHNFKARGTIFIPVYNVESYLNNNPRREDMACSTRGFDYGYAIYCSECGMSALYYKYKYNIRYTPTHVCPDAPYTNAGDWRVWDDSTLVGTGAIDGSDARTKYDNVRRHASGCFNAHCRYN